MEDKQSDFLDIGGMTCQSCVVRIEKKVGKLEGVEQVTVNLATNIAEVTYAKDKIKLSEIIKNIEKIGYEAQIHKENAVIDDKAEKIEKEELLKLKVAMGFAIPILYIAVSHMFSLPLPSIINPETEPVAFSLLQLLLSLPIMWVSRYIYKRIQGIKSSKS